MAEIAAGRIAPSEPRAEQASDPGGNRPASRGGRLKAFARRVYGDDCKLQWALLAFMALCYGALFGISWRLAQSDPLRLTFNSMLEHMLHGRFDVDPQVVKTEGFLRNGRIYSYFGVWCALLRLPLWIVRRMNVDITFWSCLTAVCVAGMAKVRAVLLIRKRALDRSSASWAIGLMLAYVVLGGSAIAYLAESLYQEAMFWAYAFAAIFVYFAVKGIVRGSFDMRALTCMATCAGLALLTRVSAGVGLILATLLLLFALVLQPRAGEMLAGSPRIKWLANAVTEGRILLPLGILAVFIAATGAVNYFRWGNPAVFANYDLYMERNSWPSFVSSLHTYGAFNLRRIPFGLAYYFLPVWVLHCPSGQLLFESTLTRLFGDIELPPSSFLLTDLLPLCFILLLAVAAWRRRGSRSRATGQWVLSVSLGLLAPCVLMLTLAWMIYRYRLEFYPEIDFLALLGLYFSVTDEAMLAKLSGFRRWLTAALTVSVFASFMALALFDLSGDELPQFCCVPGSCSITKVKWHSTSTGRLRATFGRIHETTKLPWGTRISQPQTSGICPAPKISFAVHQIW